MSHERLLVQMHEKDLLLNDFAGEAEIDLSRWCRRMYRRNSGEQV